MGFERLTSGLIDRVELHKPLHQIWSATQTCIFPLSRFHSPFWASRADANQHTPLPGRINFVADNLRVCQILRTFKDLRRIPSSLTQNIHWNQWTNFDSRGRKRCTRIKGRRLSSSCCSSYSKEIKKGVNL